MTRERVWVLLARKLAGESSEKEAAELEKLTGEDPELAYQYEILLQLWNSTGFSYKKDTNGVDAKNLLQKLKQAQ